MVKKAIVLKAPGTNNDYETNHALEKAGAQSEIVHINELARGEKKMNDYAILVIPGGFSYGDDLGAGKVYSLFLKYKLGKKLKKFVKKGKIVLGICNGFQVLAKSCILPEMTQQQEVTLENNDTGRFICKWVRLRLNNKLFWFDGLPDEIELPVAHAEGKFISLPKVMNKLKKNNQIALSYIENPNGSQQDIAGIVNNQGNVLGMMPHPERCYYGYQNPGYSRDKSRPWGKKIYENIVRKA